jgi:hypothetical protein
MERWFFDSECDCCKRPRQVGERWCEEHATMGGSGFNFCFCPECNSTRRGECDKIMFACLLSWKKQCEE